MCLRSHRQGGRRVSSYGPLADFYDMLTEDVDYQGLFFYLMEHLRMANITPGRILDMACGTGSLSMLFSKAGIETIGMDLSIDMVRRAREKATSMRAPSFIQGNMTTFKLSEPVDALVCMLDSFNYLTDPGEGISALRCFYQALNPGGMLIYDIRPRQQLMQFDGQMFMDETDNVVCIWRTEFDEEENLCHYGMDLFIREGTLWRREREEHYEYAFRLRWLYMVMQQLGFRDICCYGDRTFTRPEAGEARVFITARRG